MFCFKFISGAVPPIPEIENVYGFSSASLLAILIVADLFPGVVGENVISNVVELPALTGVEAIWLIENSPGSVPPIETILGVPVKFKLAAPVFSMVKVTALEELPVNIEPNA